MLIPGFASGWAVIGLFNLLFLSWSDVKTRLVDDRFNFLMMGVTLSLTWTAKRSLSYIVILLLLVLFVRWAAKKAMSEADNNALSWMAYGSGIIGAHVFNIFAIGLIIVMLAALGAKKAVNAPSIPFYPVLLGVFVLIVFGGWYV